MLASKTLLGGYRIEKLIGQGGYGEVYLAYDSRLGREVALKLLSRQAFWLEPEKYQKALKRFEREAKIITSLQHVAIVPVVDFGEDQGYSFIVMRLMKGGSLADTLENGPLNVDEIVRILTWLAPALDKVHREGIIHRDLKPSNILFDEDKAPYLADFGIAKLIDANTKLTRSGARIGTGYYMSPEQARGDSKIDGRSDLYSLGATLFEMLTGSPPYHRAHPGYAPYLHINEPPPRINELRTDLPHEFQAIIDRVMAKKPEDRYATAHEFAAAVKALVEKKKQEAQQARHQAQLEQLRQQAEVARRQAEWEKQQREASEREKAKLERQLRQAEAARRQAEWEKQQREAAERRQAELEKQGRQAARRQPTPPPIRPSSLWSQPTPPPIKPTHKPTITPSIKRLSPWNPLDHWHLLWWTLMEPQQLKAYRKQHGEKADLPTAKWLISTLFWLPFFLPFSAVGFEIVPFVPPPEFDIALTTVHYLWASGGLVIAWFLTGVFGDRGFVFWAVGVVVVVLTVVLAVVLTGRVAEGVAVIPFAVLLVLRPVLLLVLLLVVLGVVLSGGFIVVIAAANSVAISAAVGIVLLVAQGLGGVIEESLKTGHASWKTKGAFGLLVAANAFLLWFSYLGGWRMF